MRLAVSSENSDHIPSGNSGHLELRDSSGTVLADSLREGTDDRYAEAPRGSGAPQAGHKLDEIATFVGVALGAFKGSSLSRP
jgi:hypothetical protein